MKVWDWGSVHAWVRRAVPGLVGNDRHLTRHEMAEAMVRLADARITQRPMIEARPTIEGTSTIEHIAAVMRSVQEIWPMRGDDEAALRWARASR